MHHHTLPEYRRVLYAGGFSGSDPVIDGDNLAELVANGEVRYVLWGSGGGLGGSTNSRITTYLQSSCTVVDDAGLGTATGTTQSTDGRGGMGGASTLYQCGV